mmetsp:Transcript_125753/g.355598  ORF Transcript_125753/g.355598 Transcript_125753/m.355598 type:complete len:246 (-) Transcript_125753:53-790(-)|eukprot:CAMPEP_0179297684 /NCGR_PEP_ID=MMETSP0797-20121207/45595_1 /TAXON_ID=47934 /ORGANISM="Dinophysis acuminata, Strain DAEP01" /LENGTH=245 /DNA_ID=CAMNT_0021007029 /DNA_START=47 /DNA_END=784 /DNA_ORIENTATION=+
MAQDMSASKCSSSAPCLYLALKNTFLEFVYCQDAMARRRSKSEGCTRTARAADPRGELDVLAQVLSGHGRDRLCQEFAPVSTTPHNASGVMDSHITMGNTNTAYWKLFVGGVPPKVTSHRLHRHFSTYGRVVDAVIMRRHGQSRGFGFVMFDSPEPARMALSQPQWLEGRYIDVKQAVPQENAITAQPRHLDARRAILAEGALSVLSPPARPYVHHTRRAALAQPWNQAFSGHRRGGARVVTAAP